MTKQVCVGDLSFSDRVWNSGSVTSTAWSIWPITQPFWAFACAGMVIIIPVPYSSWTYYIYPREQTDDEAEALIFWSPGMKNWLIGKDPDAGKDWGQEEKGTAEDETVGWHHWLDGYEFKQAPGVADRQGTLVCCNPWGRKESGMTEWPNWEQMWTSL